MLNYLNKAHFLITSKRRVYNITKRFLYDKKEEGDDLSMNI